MAGKRKREAVARSAVAHARAWPGDEPLEWLFLRPRSALPFALPFRASVPRRPQRSQSDPRSSSTASKGSARTFFCPR